jgi:hypothetical protein
MYTTQAIAILKGFCLNDDEGCWESRTLWILTAFESTSADFQYSLLETQIYERILIKKDLVSDLHEMDHN